MAGIGLGGMRLATQLLERVSASGGCCMLRSVTETAERDELGFWGRVAHFAGLSWDAGPLAVALEIALLAAALGGGAVQLVGMVQLNMDVWRLFFG